MSKIPVLKPGFVKVRQKGSHQQFRLPSQDKKGLAYIKEITSTLDVWHEAIDAIAEARQIIL